MTKIMKKFHTVSSDELSETPMKAPPMKIHLKDNAKPFRISTARQVPLRFKEESDKEVQSFIDKGVIVKVTEPTTYRTRICLLYTSPSPRDGLLSRMPSSA